MPIQLCSGAALAAGKELLEKQGGKVLLFATNFSSKGPGQLKSRADPKEYNTDAEKKLFMHSKEHQFYN